MNPSIHPAFPTEAEPKAKYSPNSVILSEARSAKSKDRRLQLQFPSEAR